jgi:hypothetical protein
MISQIILPRNTFIFTAILLLAFRHISVDYERACANNLYGVIRMAT